MNTLLEGNCRMKYFTDLRLVFEAINQRQLEFNWLISDLQYLGPDDADNILNDPHWICGAELTRIVETHDLQFIWAVLSGFDPSVQIDLTKLQTSPFADGNAELWSEMPQIQHPLAEVEIVCWDSTSTLLLCKDDTLTQSFRRFFPEAVDLNTYNRAWRVKKDAQSKLAT
jgi:hypothetical protein